MKWLVRLEIDDDPIVPCRLMNVFRRKGLKIVTLTMSAGPPFTVLALVDTPESDIDHLFHILRQTGGVRHVTYYLPQAGAQAPLMFLDSETDGSGVARLLQAFPEARVICGSSGKYVLELPRAASGSLSDGVGAALLPLARVRSTRADAEVACGPA